MGLDVTSHRCKFDVELSDSTGLITATAFGEIAESLFGITAEELYDNTNEVRSSIINLYN